MRKRCHDRQWFCSDRAFLRVVVLLVRPFGYYMTRVFKGERTFLSLPLRPLERAIYALSGVKEDEEQDWKSYGLAVLTFSLAGFLALYALQRLQAVLPFNPQHLDAVSPDLAFNTSVSFVTNTNWQSYTPETTMSYLTQMAGLTVHNFVSAATGIALAIALIRGFARRSARTIGNFWVDMTRTVLYVLLPIAIVVGLFFVWQGMPQNLGGLCRSDDARRRQTGDRPGSGGFAGSHQNDGHQRRRLLQRQFCASLRESERPHQFRPDGADFFDRRVAHQCLRSDGRQGAAGLGDLRGHGHFVFGRRVHRLRHRKRRQSGFRKPAHRCRAKRASGRRQHGRQGGAVRHRQFVPLHNVTTDASCGAVNNMHDSLLPLGGMVPMVNIMLGEIIFGGVGSGLYGMLLFAIVAVFVAGLMVGRTPEYLGKKLEAKEVKMAILAILILPLSMLGFTAIAVVVTPGLAGLANSGPHGFSEALYAYVSATGNNGSAFAGLSANTPFWNTTLGLAMWIGRFLLIVPMLAVAGSLAGKKLVPASAGTFPTDGGLFVGLLIGVILIMGGLIYFPALALGPIEEHLAMRAGSLF